jgi:hypothetical protein
MVEQTLTVRFSANGQLEETHYRTANGSGKHLAAVVKDIVFGDAIPREHFAMPNEPGVEVRDLRQLNQWDVAFQVMNSFATAYQTLAKAIPRIP